MRWETMVTSEFFGRKIKLLTVSARPSEEGEQRDGAARSLSAVRATLALAEVGFAPPGASSGIPALPGASRRRRGRRGAGKGTRKRSTSGKVTKWRALVYCRSLSSFPAIDTLPERSGMRSWGRGLGFAASRGSSRARPALPSLGGYASGIQQPRSERLHRPKGPGESGGRPRKIKRKITQARRENNGLINKPQSESDEIARRSLPINSKL